MEKLLTVVVPSYNVAQYLPQTLESFCISKQYLEKIEILIVDDGSKDDTAKIGREYERQYPGVYRVISKENGGHGSTINRGIKEGIGKYFKVVDGDDWVDTQGFENMVKQLETCDCDFVITNYYEVNDQKKKKTGKSFEVLQKDKSMDLEDVIDKIQIPMHALTIKTDILKKNSIRLDENCFYVDVEYVLYPIPFAKDVLYLDEYVYMYRLALATQSVSMAGYQKHMQNHIDVILNLSEFLSKYMKEDGNEKRIEYISTRIAQMAHNQVDIFLSFPLGQKSIREKFIEFDRALKKKNQFVYDRTGTYSGLLRTLRKFNFIGYYPLMYFSKKKNQNREV